MRRAILPVALIAALVPALPAAATLQPVRRTVGELVLPRVREGVIRPSAAHRRGRIRVVVRLAQQPLARWASTRSFARAGARARLETSSSSSRAYLRALARAQTAAVATLQREIPDARVTRRFQVVLNGLAVDLPARELPRLVRLRLASRVYPSLAYRLALNAAPSLIEAGAFSAATGDYGDGMKIGVVDDGIDPTNPFFSPAGFTYPAGFPKGGRRWTTPKVIVARVFPGPNSGRGGRLALDRTASFHGTHVAGIAAGDAGVTAPRGDDHPATEGLSGVAPRAYLGNYRVFTVPTSIGNLANTPEIIAAFEAAVEDGMDVINFSGGGPETEPANDAMIETIANVAAAGVVPVISAGNDRDEFGFGTAGSPGTAPEAISVAAVGNTQVFAPVIRPSGAPAGLERIPYRPSLGERLPVGKRTLVDVASLQGTDGRPVDAKLCGSATNPNGAPSTLPPGSLRGAIALVDRGVCTFLSKSQKARAAGAIGILFVDNRPGEANAVPAELLLPSATIADEDGRRLREDVLRPHGGRGEIAVTRAIERVEVHRGGTITSFSSAGPTAFGHRLKPDISAPGGQILSSTLPQAGGPFAVFDGTSMAAPHIAGAAALLLQRHPTWTPQQVKSALISTARAAWEDTAETYQAPVTLAGGGLASVLAADSPRIFTAPASLSFGDVDARGGATTAAMLVRVQDAGAGGGNWSLDVQPQAATGGATLETPAALSVPPGGDAFLTVAVRVRADAEAGENYGFVTLRNGADRRRIPYLFLVKKPALSALGAQPLRLFQTGTTAVGTSRVSAYRYPTAPFGPAPDYVGPPMRMTGSERLYTIRLREPVANFGATVVVSSGRSIVDPFVLGSKDENDVQGAAGTPVNANPLTFDYRADIGTAGAETPRAKTYFVAVDSGRDVFTGRSLAGRYLLHSWIDDVFPPAADLLTTRVSAGRPTLVFRVVDGPFARSASGVNPLSLTIGYSRTLVGAAAYDPVSGIAVFPLPREAPALGAGQRTIDLAASDLQEAKNLNTSGADVMPNTSFSSFPLRVVRGPAATWITPETRQCVSGTTALAVVASSTSRIRRVSFFRGTKRLATDRTGPGGLYSASWKVGGLHKGRHKLRAVVVDARGRRAAAERVVRRCG